MRRIIKLMTLCISFFIASQIVSLNVQADEVIEAYSGTQWLSVEGIEGGDIEFDYDTGTITSASTYITQADIPSSINGVDVIIIGDYAFSNCHYLESVTIPYGVTILESGVFLNCGQLKTIDIPETVEEIGSSAFYDCVSLEEIMIPKDVTYIGGAAFGGCTSLKEFMIPKDVTYIGLYAFSECTSLEVLQVESGNLSYVSSDNVLYTSDMLTLVACAGMKAGEFEIPNTVISIQSGAFWGCSYLTNIQIPDSVTAISSIVFSGCTSLESIMVDENNSQYSSYDGVLYNKGQTELLACPEGKAGVLIMPDTVTVLSSGACSGCVLLTDIVFSEKLETIENEGVGYCTSLISIEIPDSVTEIEANAFRNCTSLTTVVLPNGIEYLSMDLFSSCTSLVSIEIPENVTVIDANVFQYCTSLESIVIPDSVISIGLRAFDGCMSLEYVDIGNGVTTLEHAVFNDCRSLESIVLPKSLTTVSTYIFMYCDMLTDIYFVGNESEWNAISGIENLVVYEDITTVHYNYIETMLEGDSSNVTNPTIDEESIQSLFTQNDRDSGEELSILMKVSDMIEEDLSEKEMQSINEIITLSEVEIGMILNIEIEKVIGDTVSSVSDLEEEIKITITIPEELQFSDKEYVMIRVHDGIAELLEDLDDDPTTFTFSSDRFSTYALGYTSIYGNVGDVSGDDEMNVTDIMMIYKFINEVDNLTTEQQEAADVNGDGAVDVIDIMVMYKHINEVELLF